MSINQSGRPRSLALFATFYALIAAIGGFLFGYDTAVISGAIGFIAEKFELGAGMKGWTVSSLIVGAAVGAAISGGISDAYGRKKTLIAASVLFAAGSIGSAFPRTVAEMIGARIVGGVGVGMVSTLAPLYIAEIAPARIRGRLVSVYQFAVVTGIFATFFINKTIAGFGGDAWDVSTAWRWMLGFGVVPGVLYLLLLLFVPETPRWLMRKRQEARALTVLERMNGKEAAKAELAEMLNVQDADQGTLKELFRPALRIPLNVGVGLAVLQQITGINAIMYYAPEILKQTGAGTDAALTQTVLVGLVNFAFTLIALWLIDIAGRRALLLAGSSVMTVCLFAVAYGFDSPNVPANFVLVFILLYVAAFAVSLGPVVWVMISEIFPTRIRGRATAFASMALWTADYVVSQTFPMLLESIGTSVTFLLFAVISLATVIFCVKLVPETKGRSLEEIERLWANPPFGKG